MKRASHRRAVTPPRRLAIAGLLSFVVLALLGTGWYAMPRTVEFGAYLHHGNAVAQFPADVDSPAADDGIERGDRVAFRDQTSARTRTAFLLGQAAKGERLPVRVNDGSVTRSVAGRSLQGDAGMVSVFSAIVALFALFGLFVLWRGRDWTSFWLGIFCMGIAAPLLGFFGPLPPPLAMTAFVADLTFELAAYFAMLQMAIALAGSSGETRWIRPLRTAAGGILTVAWLGIAVPTLLRAAVPTDSSVLTWLSLTGGWAISVAQVGVLTAAPLVVVYRAARSAASAQRAQLRFVYGTMLVALAPPLLGALISLARGREPAFGPQWLTLSFIPIGLGYAIPRYRFIDVALISRVVVNGVLTFLLGAAITLFETLADSVIHPHEGGTSQTNVWLSFLLAFFIVMSVREFHERLEHALEALLFRRRTAALRALGMLTRHALRYREKQPLYRHAVDTIHDALDPSAVAVYETDGERFVRVAFAGSADALPREVPRGDPAIPPIEDGEALALADVASTRSGFGDEGLLYPLAACGTLLGVLLCGPRADEFEGDYDGEELDALESLADRLGEAVYVMSCGAPALLADRRGLSLLAVQNEDK